MSDERAPRDLDVPATPVAARGTRAPWLVLGGMALVVASAVAIAQLEPTPAPATAPAILATPSASAAPSAVSLRPPAAVPPRLQRGDLAERVRDGSLDGRLVFVDGVLETTPVVSIPGIGLPVTAAPGALPWRDGPPPGSWIVTVARDGGLTYLGSLLPDDDLPDDPTELARRLADAAMPSRWGTLFEVTGWLVLGPPIVCRGDNVQPATPCPVPPPFLAAEEPRADGTLRSDRGAEVAIQEPVVGIDPGSGVWGGTFLVSPPAACDPSDGWAGCVADRPWVVVARYEPSRSVRVQVP